MKKFYALLSSLLISTISFAQVTKDYTLTYEDEKIHKSNHLVSSDKSVPFWSEDFSNGIPSSWTNSSVPWVYRGPNTNPNVATGSQGAYAGTQGPIASATASNGFMIFDSDYYDNGGAAGAFGSGQYPANGPVNPGHVGTLTTDSIDCSMYPDITLRMHSFYREYTGIAKVAFSIDGGVTFTDTIEVHPDIEVNERTENDYVVMVRMPFNIVGNTNVQIQFIYDGTVMYNTYYGYYFWQIDDIELIETPPYMMTVVDVNHGGWNTTPISEGFGMDYTYQPLHQSLLDPYSFEATLANSGANTLYNVQLNVIVEDDAGTQVYSGTSSATTLNVLDTLITTTTQGFSPTSTGVYTMSFWGSADSIPFTDTSYMQAVITDSVYGRDYNNPGGSWYVGRSCGGMQLGNIFDLYEGDTLTSVSAYIADYSVPGAQMFGVIYEVDTAVSPMGFIYLNQTDDYTITSSDTNNWVHIAFSGGEILTQGQYMIAIGGYANPVDTFGINVSGDAPVSMSRIQDNGCDIGSGGFGYWYWISSTPMIRMNFANQSSSSTSINENIFSGKLTVFPNPTNGLFTIDLVDVNDGDYKIMVINSMGELVDSKNKFINSTGSTQLDLSHVSSGVYLLKISNEEDSIYKKIIVE